MRGAAVLLAFGWLAVASPVTAAEWTVRGRVVDEKGAAVAGAEVATAWTADAKGLRPLAGATTDADGRFALSRPHAGTPVALLAYDDARARGALRTVAPSALADEQVLVLGPLVRLHGKVTTENGKYVLNCVCWLSPAKDVAPAVRVAVVKGEYAVKVPAGAYDFAVQSAQKRPARLALELAAEQADREMETIDLEQRVARVQTGERAPPMTYEVGDADLDAALRRGHLPSRWTLCYFWAHR
jgi:hypothetical protein